MVLVRATSFFGGMDVTTPVTSQEIDISNIDTGMYQSRLYSYLWGIK